MSHFPAQESEFGYERPQATSLQELAKVFNTAIVATRAEAARDYTTELYALIQTPAFQAILESVRALSRMQGIEEREAAELIVQTFRRVDQVWQDYILHEGVDRLKGQLSS